MPQQVRIDPDSPAHDTLEDAVRAMTGRFDKKSKNETAGMIFKDSAGKFRYSTTINGTDDRFEMHIVVPKGHSIAGILHTHPGLDERGTVFSPNDIDTAHQLNIPSYVNFADGSLRKYIPGKTSTQPFTDVGSKIPLRVSKGDPLDAPVTAATDTQQQQAVSPSDSTSLVVVNPPTS